MKPNPSRVAQRWMQGGLFQGPPAFEAKIVSWVEQVVAEGVLADLDSVADPTAIFREGKNQIQRALLTVVRDIEDLGEGEKMRLPYFMPKWVGGQTTFESGALGVYREDLDNYMIEVVRGRGRFKWTRSSIIGQFDGPHEAASEVVSWLKDGLKDLERVISNAGSSGLSKDLEHIRAIARQYASKGKLRKSKVSREIPLDLAGWRYVPNSSEAESKLRTLGWDKIKVVLSFLSAVTYQGFWKPDQKLIQINLPEIGRITRESYGGRQNQNWEKYFAPVSDTVRHEVEHLGQALLQELKGLKELAGLPSPHMRTPGFDSYGDPVGRGKTKPHELRDIEFYTRLGDEVAEAVRYLRTVDPKDRRAELRKWSLQGDFFGELHKHEPRKWQKAVAEYIKAVSSKIEVP